MAGPNEIKFGTVNIQIHLNLFRSHNLQTDDINDTSLSIEEVIDLLNPAFIGNNDSFILLF